MNRPPQAELASCLKRFLGEYLPHQRAFSTHTIHSYRDGLKLLLQYTAGKKRRVADLGIADLGPSAITAFLNHLETKRNNSPATRNVRLAAIHAFFDYLGCEHPDHLDQSQRVLSIPFKRTTHRSVEYLEADELRAILASIDRSTAAGRRDYALITLLFNTGARVQEVVSLKTTDLRLTAPPSVRLLGKGRKERLSPLWPETARLLRQQLADQGLELNGHDPQLLFRNHRGGALTRFGARLILQRHVRRAAESHPSLKRKRIHPHSLRHSTAVHLLKSGVDLSTIAHWLGHASITTTHKYVAIDLEAKRELLAKAGPLVGTPAKTANWRTNQELLKWLESL
jgi:integrase/recombinase XerD